MNTNLRALRRTSDGLFTMTPKSFALEERDLCGRCCVSMTCSVFKHSVLANQSDVTSAVISCPSFSAPLTFREQIGFVNGCNTLRIGYAWHSRVNVGDQVGLYDVLKDEIFATATVSKKAVGLPLVILDGHAKYNHYFTGRRITKAKAAEEMKELMPKLNGNLIWKNARALTALYFDNITQQGDLLCM